MSYEFRVKIAFQNKKNMIGILGHIVFVVLPYNKIVYITNSGWSGGAMVLSKLLAPGRPTTLDNSRARAYCAYSRCGWGLFWTFFLSSIISLFFLPLSGRRPDID